MEYFDILQRNAGLLTAAHVTRRDDPTTDKINDDIKIEILKYENFDSIINLSVKN